MDQSSSVPIAVIGVPMEGGSSRRVQGGARLNKQHPFETFNPFGHALICLKPFGVPSGQKPPGYLSAKSKPHHPFEDEDEYEEREDEEDEDELGGVPEDGEEVAGSSGGNEQMPDEMAITELLGQVKSDPAGVSESAGGQPQ